MYASLGCPIVRLRHTAEEPQYNQSIQEKPATPTRDFGDIERRESIWPQPQIKILLAVSPNHLLTRTHQRSTHDAAEGHELQPVSSID